MNKATVISVVVAGLLVLGGLMLAGDSEGAWQSDNVSTSSGTQVVEITAKGGYMPRQTTAHAKVATVLKVKTQGTFDCAAALTIPSIGYRAMLKPTGEVAIEIPPQKEGSVLQGVCAMGMYNFQIRFN